MKARAVKIPLEKGKNLEITFKALVGWGLCVYISFQWA
jgi:hypothetical protein